MYKPSATICDDEVSTEEFTEEDIAQVIWEHEEHEPWEYSNYYSVWRLKNGRYISRLDESWGTCDYCGDSEYELLASASLESLYNFGFTDRMREMVPLEELIANDKN